jgi:hypothetical protein
MQIRLRPELQRFVEEKVRQGHYPTTDAMLEEALALLYARDHEPEFTSEHEAYIREHLARAEADVERGRVTTVDDAGLRQLMTQIMQRGRQRLAAATRESQ